MPVDVTARMETARPRAEGAAFPAMSTAEALAVSRPRGVLLALTERTALHPIPPGLGAGDPDLRRQTVPSPRRRPDPDRPVA